MRAISIVRARLALLSLLNKFKLPVTEEEVRSIPPEREFFIDNLLVRIHFIIEMIWWTGLAPWEFEFPFPCPHLVL